MKWHIRSRLFPQWDELLPFFLIKSDYFKFRNTHFIQNCCSFQYIIKRLCFDVADVVLKLPQIWKRWVSRNCLFNLKRCGGGEAVPLVRRLPAISYRILLWSQNVLTISINVQSTRYLSHFFTILTGIPEM